MTAIEEEELRKSLSTLVHLHHYGFCDNVASRCYKSKRSNWTPECEARAAQYEDKLVSFIQSRETALSQQHEREIAESYLSHFSYVDWDIGEDDKLRLGDYINCNHQRPYDGYEQNFEGQIVAHHVNSLPVILYNLDPKEPDNSGDYADLQSLMMDGWEFSRIKELQQQSNGEKI